MSRAHTLLFLALAFALSGCALLRKPGSDDVDLAFQGHTTFSDRDLYRVLAVQLSDFAKTTYKKSAVDDMAYEVERHYNSEGFPFASVGYEYEEASETGRKPRARLRIQEGPRTELGRVSFEGNLAIEARTLREFFAPSSRRVWEEDHEYYVESHVSTALSEIAREYIVRGFMDVSISDPVVTFDADRTRADVHVTIDEGTRYSLAAVRFEGELVFASSELEAAAASFLGEPFAERVALEIEGRVEDLYAGRGYADVSVEHGERQVAADGKVTLAYRIVPGPIVTIGSIAVHGDDKTHESFVLSRLKVKPGDRYSRTSEREAHSRLYQTGLFKTVKLSLEPVEGDVTTRALTVKLEESPSLEVYFEPGYGSYEELRISGGIRERNLFGQGLILQGEGTLARLAQRGKISLIDPWFLGSDVSADFSLFGNQRQEPSFDKMETGLGIDFKRRFGRFHETNLGYQYKQSEVSNVDIVDPVPQGGTDDVNISSVALTHTFDQRDDVIQTRRGLLTKATVEFADEALGSELDFVRARLNQSFFVALSENATMGFSLRTGVIIPIEDTETIPIQERFFNGGENTVRSFKENELGPKDSDNNPIGGEAWSVGSVEWRNTIVGNLDGALFYDIGNVVLDYDDYFEFRGLREAIGIGVRYQLPVGPMRLDWGVNPDPDGDEVRSVLHFSVGMAF